MLSVPVPMICKGERVYMYDTRIVDAESALALIYLPSVKDWKVIDITELLPDQEFRNKLHE